MRKKMIIGGSIVLTLLLVTGATSCLHMGMNHKEFAEDHAEFILFKITKELKLTDDQQAYLKEAMAEIKAKKEELHGNEKAHLREVKKLIRSEHIDENELNVLLEEQHEKMKVMAELIKEKLIEFHSTLTDDQKETIIEFIEKHHENKDK